ncbi:polyamine-modulated factor 1-binding protein 1 isoform 1-T1 [Pluvialis apricaria]
MQHPLTQLPSLQLRAQEEQSQGLRHSLARLQEELGATCIQKQQSLQQLSEAKETIQDLHQEVACNRKHLAELLQQVQDMATLQAELAQAKQEKAKQEEKIGAYEEQRKQLQWELRKLQGAQEQSKQEVSTSQAFPRGTRRLCSACVSLTASLCHRQAHSLQEKLQELSSQAQHWQQLHQDSEQALAVREEELVVCKVELAFLKEELRKAKEQVQDRNRQHRSPRAGAQAGPLAPGNDRSWPTGRAEVERTGQGTVYCRSQATKGSGSSRAEYLVLLKLALFAPLLERSPSAWNYRVVTEVHGQ